MGVFVLGMHRSGTSSVTRLIDLLGVPVGGPQLPPQSDNPEGFWEVAPLMQLNDELLAHLGGAWDVPPDPQPGWESDAALDEMRERAARVFHAAHPGAGWVWKDPRACLLLRFWRPLTGSSDVAVIVLRNPLDVAHSLNRRSHMSTTYGMVLWERYMRVLSRDAGGLPALVVRYDDALDDPTASAQQMREFLVARGQLDAAAPYDLEAVRAFLRADLRHAHRTRADLDIDGRVSPAQRGVFDCFDALAGEHDSFAPAPLPPETPWAGPLLAARSEVAGVETASPTSDAIDRLERELGSAEHGLAERDAEAVALRASLAAVRDALGGTDIGLAERVALRMARAIRRVQHRRRAG